MRRTLASLVVGTAVLVAAGDASADVDYGPISHKGFKTVGAASTSRQAAAAARLVANQSGLQNAVKSASNPTSSSYGKYPSLSTLQNKYGASSSKRKAVARTFKASSVTAKVDVTHLRVTATVSVGKAQKLFGTKWKVYKTGTGSKVALPVNTPKLPSGIKGNVDTVAGMRVQLSSEQLVGRARGGRGGRRDADADRDAGLRLRARRCSPPRWPRAAGLYPNQILAAYGIAPLQAVGLQRPGRATGDRRRGADASRRREHVPLVLRDAGDDAEDPRRRRRSSRSSRARSTRWSPRWWRPRSTPGPVGAPDQRERRRRRRRGLPARCLPSRCRRRPTARRCRTSSRSPTASASRSSSRTPRRARWSSASSPRTAALGHHDRRRGRRHGLLGVRARVPASQLTSSDKKPQVSWPASSPWVLAVGGTNLTLAADNTIASIGRLERHRLRGRRSPRRRAAAAARARS